MFAKFSLKSLPTSKFLIVILVILIIPTFSSLIRPGYFPMQDDLQAFRLQQLDRCVQDLRLPCRWIPDMGYQYGYPQFNFYAPSVYYLGELFHLIGFQFIDSIKILFSLAFVVSGLSMYLLLKSLTSHFASLVGSLLYIYLPYKAAEVYVRGSLSEFWAFVFFPLIFWAGYQVSKTEKKRYYGYLALSVAGLLITHTLSSLIFLPVFAVWLLYLVISQKKYQLLLPLSLTAALSLGLASFFILPLLFERQYVHTESLLGGYFDYRQHFVNLKQLFLSNYFGYGSSTFGDQDEVTLSTGIVQWIAATGGVIFAFLNRKKGYLGLTISTVILAIFVLFMIHQKSSPIWQLLPVLAWLQFPWRLLAVSGFLLSILAAIGVHLIQSTKLQLVYGLALIFIAIGLSFNFFQPKEWLNLTDQQKFSGALWEKQLTISIFDYLPIYAKLPPTHKAPDRPEILDGQAEINTYQKGSDYQTGQLQVRETATIRLPLFDFLGMKVLANGQEVPHVNNDCRQEEFCLGLITFQLPPGNYDLVAKLTDTPIRFFGNMITTLSLGILVIVSFWRKKLLLR